ncbi:CatA-like O-acetyltransferase [Candidatus Bipolaricaulota bacterium]
MRVIDIESWPRRDHFLLFCGMEFPHVNLSIEVDIADLWSRRALTGASPTVTLAYMLTKAANCIPQLRQRIRGEDVIEHDVIHSVITVLGPNDQWGVCQLQYDPRFNRFAEQATECIEESKRSASLAAFPHVQAGEQPRDDLLSITTLPWLSTTGFGITRRPKDDCIPLLAYGRVKDERDQFTLPIHLNFHHALVDGLHIARFAEHIEEEARALASRFSEGS